MIYFFSSVALFWLTGAKTTGPIVKKFLKSIFYVSENFKYQIMAIWGLSEMAYFIFVYFSTKLGTSVDGHETIIT
jgi:hypothetical protein